MNKKFSTLMAAALLAGSLPVVAQDAIWVKVNRTQLVNGAKYRITDTRNYPLVDGTATVSSGKMSWAEPAPILDKNHADPDSIWTLIKTDKGFTLKSSETSNPIYLVGDEKGAAAQMYTNENKEEAYANLILNEDGTLSDATAKGLVHSYSGLYFSEADSAAATKFSFEMLVEKTSNEVSSISELPEVKTTMYVMVGGKYVGISTSDTRGLGTGLASVASIPEEGAGNYLWLYEGGMLKNVVNGKYLTVADNGDLELTTAPVTIEYSNNVLSVNGNNAQVSLLNTSNPLPSQLPDNWSDLQTEIVDKDGNKITTGYGNPKETSIVLFARNNVAINWKWNETTEDYDYSSAVYNAQDANPFTFTLSKQAVSGGGYKVYLMQNGQHVDINGTWVELDVNATKDSWDLPANATVLLRAGNQYVAFNGSTLVPVAKNQATQFGLGQLQQAYISANSLIARYGDYFTLNISYKDEKGNDIDLTGEFEGQLRPVRKVTYYNGEADYVDAQAETDFMLVNAEGNIIVIDTKEPLHVGNTNIGYAFTTLTPKEWQTAVSKGEEDRYLTSFRMSYKPGNDQATLTEITGISVSNLAGSNTTTLYVGRQKDGENYVLVAAPEANLIDVTFKLNAGNGIAAQEWLTTPSYYTVEMINKDKNHRYYGKVLGLNEDGRIDWVAPENVDLNMPEAQFAISKSYKFTNRENKDEAYWILNGDLYKLEGAENKDIFALVTSSGIDTLRISPVKDYTPADGFRRYSAADLNAKTYTVSMRLLNGDSLNIIENHNDKHRLGLDEENATEWRIEMPTVKLNDITGDFTRMAADTVTIDVPITYYVAGKGWMTTTTDQEFAEKNKNAYVYTPNAILKVCTYILKNTDTNEYLFGKDGSESVGNAYYVCDENKESSTMATRVAFKLNEDNTVNLVPAYYGSWWMDSNNNWHRDRYNWNNQMTNSEAGYDSYAADLYLSNYKILGGTTSLTGVLKDVALYEATANDLFVITEATAPTYKKLAFGDKIAISRLANKEEVIYEKAEFLGIGNRVAHKDINPTLFVDSAYVEREGNFKYEYLLGVNTTVHPAGKYCAEHNSYTCEHGVPFNAWTEGRYLVNMVDSAEANKDVHNNKFMYDGDYKLAFVNGYHRNDTLYVTNEAGEVISKLAVGNADSNIAKFAFKMVDETDNEFVIETASGYSKKENLIIDNSGHWHWTVASKEATPGYLRWINGNLVVTDNIDEAEHFTMEASDKEATANENIAAGNVVVAGVDGAVVVKGAEGKNVIVSTILGKVVANEVVSSDNATIAAPAGIVVVSVDGESFKVVVK